MALCEEVVEYIRKGEKKGERLPLLLLLAVRRMRREHTRRMSKDVEDACQLEGL
jgi:hypothetical protein